MPELPEVETVRLGLTQLVVGKTIESIDIYWPKIIESPEPDQFKLAVAGETIESVDRRGKYLIFKLTHWDMLSHLRMEGKYEFYSSKIPADKHTHIVFNFADGTQLQYRDVRKFGRFTLVGKDQSAGYKGIQKLGPEPFPATFFLDDFRNGLKKSTKAIKAVLLDQKVVTGLGNIYTDEALWQAKIHPRQPANTLTKKETERLHVAIMDVLQRSLDAGGTTVRSYANALGEAGKFQLSLHAYGQTGLPCPRCGTPIKKIVVTQRGTHYCPECQKLRIRKASKARNMK